MGANPGRGGLGRSQKRHQMNIASRRASSVTGASGFHFTLQCPGFAPRRGSQTQASLAKSSQRPGLCCPALFGAHEGRTPNKVGGCQSLLPLYAASLLASKAPGLYLWALRKTIGNAHGSKLPSDSGRKRPHSTVPGTRLTIIRS